MKTIQLNKRNHFCFEGKSTLLLLYIFFIYYGSFTLHAQVASSTLSILKEKGILSVKTSTIFSNADNLIEVWAYKSVPVSFYSDEEIKLQKAVNKRVSDALIVSSPKNDEQNWTSIDQEEITPYTWKWIELELLHENQNKSTIYLRRPNWWIKSIGADSIGKKVFIDMPEMGIVGSAFVTKIYPNQLDTRFWDEERTGDFVNRPITGKFIHRSNDVYDLYFEDSVKPLGVTGNHPIWSLDRAKWIQANDLVLGEKVKTRLGYTKLIKIQKKCGNHTVFNIEVYRDHNYFASLQAVNVHNDCFAALRVLVSKQTMARLPLTKLTNYFSVRMASEFDKVTGVYRILATTLQANGPSNPAGILGVIKQMKQMAKEAGALTVDIKAEGLSTDIAKGIFKNKNGEKLYGLTVEYAEVDYGGMKVGSARIYGRVRD